jgi:hypothetical protein
VSEDWWFNLQQGKKIISLLHSIQTTSLAHTTSYRISTEGSLPDRKVAGHEADQFAQSNAKVKNAWSYTATLLYVLTA